VVAESGHTEMLWRQPEASERLLTSFYDTGKADDSLFTYQSWEYNTSLGFPALAKILIAVALILALLIGWAVWALIRRRLSNPPQ